jgi:hypothetical protein
LPHDLAEAYIASGLVFGDFVRELEAIRDEVEALVPPFGRHLFYTL